MLYIKIYRGRLVHSVLFLEVNKNSNKSNQDTRPRVWKARPRLFGLLILFSFKTKRTSLIRGRVFLDKIRSRVFLPRKSLILNNSPFLQIFGSGISSLAKLVLCMRHNFFPSVKAGQVNWRCSSVRNGNSVQKGMIYKVIAWIFICSESIYSLSIISIQDNPLLKVLAI